MSPDIVERLEAHGSNNSLEAADIITSLRTARASAESRVKELEELCCQLEADCFGYASDAASAESRATEAEKALDWWLRVDATGPASAVHDAMAHARSVLDRIAKEKPHG